MPSLLSSDAFDEEGYLQDAAAWNEALAQQLADELGIDLTPDHWEVIQMVRNYYGIYGISPSMRPLVRYLGEELGPDKGRSVYLLQLFRNPVSNASPALSIARLAGLPRPENCL